MASMGTVVYLEYRLYRWRISTLRRLNDTKNPIGVADDLDGQAAFIEIFYFDSSERPKTHFAHRAISSVTRCGSVPGGSLGAP